MWGEIDLEMKQDRKAFLKVFFLNVTILAGNLSWLRECLDNRVGVNGLDKAGSTALYWACHGGHKGILFCVLFEISMLLNMFLPREPG